MHDYKSRKLLERHNETSFHKRKVDPVFAESELAAKKEKQALDAADPVKIAAVAARTVDMHGMMGAVRAPISSHFPNAPTVGCLHLTR